MRVLVAEDEKALVEILVEGLRAKGIAVDSAFDGGQALERLAVNRYDVLVLDRDLPVVHGDDVCRAVVASEAPTRVLMLTAFDTLADRVRGLDLGADDYLAKPFAFEELLARIRAHLRPRADAPPGLLRVGSICIDLIQREVKIDGRTWSLSAREFSLLKAFADHPRQVLSRQELLSMAWGMNFDPGTNLVDVYVGYLRRKLGETVIDTVRGAGYRLRADGQDSRQELTPPGSGSGDTVVLSVRHPGPRRSSRLAVSALNRREAWPRSVTDLPHPARVLRHGCGHWCRRGVARSHQSMVSASALMRSRRPAMNSA